jgi:hypothetical protein
VEAPQIVGVETSPVIITFHSIPNLDHSSLIEIKSGKLNSTDVRRPIFFKHVLCYSSYVVGVHIHVLKASCPKGTEMIWP